MTTPTGRTGLSRRTVLQAAGTGLIVAAVTPAGQILGAPHAWAATAEALTPTTFATLVQMSRDIYPHRRLEDTFYAAAVATLDKATTTDAAVQALLEAGVAALDTASTGAPSGTYRGLSSAEARVAQLQAIATSPFFQKVRGNLMTGLYNNKALWPLFGYEGESASKGGYLHRGFNDINWL